MQKKGNLIKKREKQKKEQKTEWHRKNNSNDYYYSNISILNVSHAKTKIVFSK